MGGEGKITIPGLSAELGSALCRGREGGWLFLGLELDLTVGRPCSSPVSCTLAEFEQIAPQLCDELMESLTSHGATLRSMGQWCLRAVSGWSQQPWFKTISLSHKERHVFIFFSFIVV